MYRRPTLKRTSPRSAIGVYKKKRQASYAAYRSIMPSRIFRPFPAQMNIQMTHSQQTNYTATSTAINGFRIVPWDPVGIDSLYPPYFEELMRIYSTAIIKSAMVKVSFISLDAATEALNIASGIITLRDSDPSNLFLNQETMDKLRSMPGSKTGFLSPTTGGRDVLTMVHYVDMSKYTEGMELSHLATTSRYNISGNVVITPPSTSLALGPLAAPVVQFLYTPTQALDFQFQIIRSITYNITFSGRHFG